MAFDDDAHRNMSMDWGALKPFIVAYETKSRPDVSTKLARLRITQAMERMSIEMRTALAPIIFENRHSLGIMPVEFINAYQECGFRHNHKEGESISGRVLLDAFEALASSIHGGAQIHSQSDAQVECRRFHHSLRDALVPNLKYIHMELMINRAFKSTGVKPGEELTLFTKDLFELVTVRLLSASSCVLTSAGISCNSSIFDANNGTDTRRLSALLLMKGIWGLSRGYWDLDPKLWDEQLSMTQARFVNGNEGFFEHDGKSTNVPAPFMKLRSKIIDLISLGDACNCSTSVASLICDFIL